MHKVNDVIDWLSQTTDNSKYFVWPSGFWDKESRLYYQVCSNDDSELTLTYFTARSNLVPYAFVWEKGKIIDFSKFFCLEPDRPIEAKFHMESPWDVGNENLFKCSRSHDHAHIWWKTSKIFFFGPKRSMTLKLGMQHRVLEYYKCFHMMTLGWPWLFLWQGQIYFRMLLHGWKLIQHWVLQLFSFEWHQNH